MCYLHIRQVEILERAAPVRGPTGDVERMSARVDVPGFGRQPTTLLETNTNVEEAHTKREIRCTASDPCLGVPPSRPVPARQVLEAAVLDQLETVRRGGEEREKEQHQRHPALGWPSLSFHGFRIIIPPRGRVNRRV